MLRATVTGSVWATRRVGALPNGALLEVRTDDGSTLIAFDGSDQMPGAVGSGSFWKGMVAWVSGQKDLDTALKDIESSWPS